jgi:predicted protein tyrosine phosphatase
MTGAERTKLLFVCSRNQWRSRTAEEIFKNRPRLSVRSAGTASSARVRVTEDHVLWADVIFVMERKHGAVLRERFPEAAAEREIHCLDIPDDYTFMDPDLIATLEAAVAPFLTTAHSTRPMPN